MSKKILILSGPTATGKTSLAVKLAQKFNGELISADSRQIYQGMDIGTGKDHPKNVPIHLIDLIFPNQTFSVAQYQKLALLKIKKIQSHGKLPIIVGGTGQYIDSLINPHTETFQIKPNRVLRFFLNKFSLKLLQLTFRLLDFQTFRLLNNSEVHNPHRLIRKIEIRLFRPPQWRGPRNDVIANPDFIIGMKQSHLDYLHLSLTAPNSYLYSQIDRRVEQRLKLGLIDEIETLLKTYSWHYPGLNTLAYKEFKPYFENNKPLESCLQRWRFDEHAYARRQKTWFKKYPDACFFDITRVEYPNNLINLLNKWYNKL